MRFSINNKTNTILTEIVNNIIYTFDEDYDTIISELNRYKTEFPFEIDYNVVQYENLLVYYDDIKKLFISCGYKNINKLSDTYIWNKYKLLVCRAIDTILYNLNKFKKEYFE